MNPLYVIDHYIKSPKSKLPHAIVPNAWKWGLIGFGFKPDQSNKKQCSRSGVQSDLDLDVGLGGGCQFRWMNEVIWLECALFPASGEGKEYRLVLLSCRQVIRERKEERKQKEEIARIFLVGIEMLTRKMWREDSAK